MDSAGCLPARAMCLLHRGLDLVLRCGTSDSTGAGCLASGVSSPENFPRLPEELRHPSGFSVVHTRRLKIDQWLPIAGRGHVRAWPSREGE